MAEGDKTRVLLLVEDNAGDAQLAAEMLEQAGRHEYQVVQVSRLAPAIERLNATPVDVIVLDLGLPDCSGVDTVKHLRGRAQRVPIVVLTGTDDDEIALACMDAGAQDYLPKSEVGVRNLKRAIGYAISRVREAEVRELRTNLDRYRQLSTLTQGTTVTAELAGSGAVAARRPGSFEELAAAYLALFTPYIQRETERVEAPRSAMERVATMLGDLNGGPRDLVDVHVAALERAMAQDDGTRSKSLLLESRLLALEMMGMLVDYYRVGQRRRFVKEGQS